LALDRLAGDVPEALIPDDEHVVLYKDIKSADSDVKARLKVLNGDGAGVTGTDKIVLIFTDTAGAGIAAGASLTTWRPTITGEWDGLMHLEITDSSGATYRRQSREWFTYTDDNAVVWYAVTIDRPWSNNTDTLMTFRIHQPEFFVRDDVMELLEPARVYDETRQQVWAVDTGGAYRQDMVDFQGNTGGRPNRMYRSRHFQLPAPTEPPQVIEANEESVPPSSGVSAPDEDVYVSGLEAAGPASGWTPSIGAASGSGMAGTPTAYQPDTIIRAGAVKLDYLVPSTGQGNWRDRAAGIIAAGDRTILPMAAAGTTHEDGSPKDPDTVRPPERNDSSSGTTTVTLTRPSAPEYQWHEGNALRSGTWGICYTYVWGRRDKEWQQSPLVTPGGHEVLDNDNKLAWSYDPSTVSISDISRHGGINDPLWESAPSPVTVISQGVGGALLLSATNLDAMLGFGDSSKKRYGRTGMRIRYYVAHFSADGTHGDFNGVETNQRYHLLCEVDPTFDHVSALTGAGVTAPSGVTFASSSTGINSGRVVWNGDQLYDYHRPMKHSTGYYAWSTYPHQNARYELDFRVLRLPRKFVDDQDTAPIQRDAVPALMELALHYVSLLDGNDQMGANIHLARYQELVRLYRQKYANPGGVVEPVPLSGYPTRHRYGTFSND
tara:strand:+ start:664 stop:2652 length:1989 start_codon:yes stop_codon:yes gene_type:complete